MVCEAADAEGRVTLAEVTGDGVEAEGAAGVEVGDEADAVGVRTHGGGEGAVRGCVCLGLEGRSPAPEGSRRGGACGAGSEERAEQRRRASRVGFHGRRERGSESRQEYREERQVRADKSRE